MKKELEFQKCCICGKRFMGYGNNPWPISKTGRCCNECNMLTIQRRVQLFAETHRHD